MENISKLISDIKGISDFNEKNSVMTVFLNLMCSKRGRITNEDKIALSQFAFSEIKALLSLIPAATDYKEKDDMFAYEDQLLRLVMLLYASPDQIPADSLKDIRYLVEMIDSERYLERSIDSIFKEKKNTPSDVQNLISLVQPINDEYHRAQVYHGLLHYRTALAELPEDTKGIFADYIASEISRYLSCDLSDEILNNLELACDVAQYFMNATIIDKLYDALKLGENNVNYYAVSTLLESGKSIPGNVVVDLANDLLYANITYSLLEKYDLLSMFPAELADTVYLAKSDLIRWLVYPTELGKAPDEIEYLGKIKKGDEYHIFRYKSDSSNLSDELKGEWLIGWSNKDGGTFSNFDLYSAFKQKNVEKTLKVIKKKLL